MFTARAITKLAFPLMLASGTILAQKKRTIFAFTYPSTKDLIRGEYENKIRSDSPPEKIFEVFATEKEGDEIFMSHKDFFTSLCPFSYSSKEEEEDDGKDDDKKDNDSKDNKKEDGDEKESKQFNSKALSEFADVDKDGKISIYEYYLVTSFIQIKRSECSQYFKSNNLVELDKDALKQFFEFIKQKSKVKLTMAGLLDPRKFSVNQEKFDKHIDLLVNNLLENNNAVPASKILKIREDILKDSYQFQFNAFPVDENGQISGEDFAKSLISYMEPKKCKQYMKFLDKVDFKGKITFEEFYLFQKFLLDNAETIMDKINQKGFTTRKQLKKLIEEYQVKLGLKVNNDQLDIFIKVLDANGNNRIEADEFHNLIQQRSKYGGGEDTSLSKPIQLIKEKGLIWMNKAERIWDIIME